MIAKKYFAFVSILFLLAFNNSMPASAHTSLISEIPIGNSVISDLPNEVSLTFDETLIVIGKANSITVIDPNGNEITTGDTRVVNNLVTRDLAVSNLVGDFTVSYRVVSEDGHVVSSSYKFIVKEETIAKPTPTTPSATRTPDETSSSALKSSNPEVVVNDEINSHNGHSFLDRHAGHFFMVIAALLLIYIWKMQSK